MFRFRRPVPLWLAITTIAGGMLIVGAAIATSCQRTAAAARAREEALEPCVEQLHDVEKCKSLIEQGHEQCTVIARTMPTRFNRVKEGIDARTYVECIVLTPSGWVDKRQRERREQEAERGQVLSGH